MGVLLGVVVAFLLFKSGVLTSVIGGVSGSPGYAPPRAIAVAAQAPDQSGAAAASGIGTALNLIPVAGIAISAAFRLLSSTLLAASAARAKAARDENSAVAQGIPGWDQGVQAVVDAYNSGSISAVQADTLLATLMQNFWAETGPHIQNGRNGCGTGANCPGSIAPNSGSAYATTAPSSYCSGSIGAACCVGCADLQLSTDNLTWAVNNASKTGQPTTAFVQQVFASKYGGVNRAAYTVTFVPPVSGITG